MVISRCYQRDNDLEMYQDIKLTCKVGYLIHVVIREEAVNLATFVAFLIVVDKRILFTRRRVPPLTKTFTN